MQAYKLKGKVDDTGNLVITEPVKMHPGDVEVLKIIRHWELCIRN